MFIYCNVKSYSDHHKINMKVKQLYLIKSFISIKKQTFMTIFLFYETENIINLIRFYLILINNLLYEKQNWLQSFDLRSKKNSLVVSQYLEDTYFKKFFLGYNHKNGVFLKHSGMYKKPSWFKISGKKYSTTSLNQNNINISVIKNFTKL